MYCYWNNQQIDVQEPLQYDKKPLAAVAGWGGIQIFDEAVDLIGLCCEYARAIQRYSCGQCIPCRAGTGVILELFEKIKRGEGSENDLDAIRNLAETISKTSMCQVGQSSPPVFIHIIENFRDALLKAIKEGKKSANGNEYRSILTAPCMQACPMHLDIPKYVEEIRFGRFEKSLDVIRERLPLPGVVGRVCVRPCEFNCRRGLIDEPIQIKHLKRFVADFEIERGQEPKETPTAQKGMNVAVVGAGPAGLTCARFLALRGYGVTVFEMLPEPGGMAAVGIPDYRLPREILRREVSQIGKLGVKFVYNRGLGPHFTLEDLEAEGFKAIFIGMGCHCHKSMGVEGEDKGYHGFVPGIYFLRNINLGLLNEIPKGKKIVVVGGGNVAIDCVRTAFRVGFEESHLVYRRSRKEMPADQVEIRDAEAEGVQFHFLTAPLKIIARDGKVTGLGCSKMELGAPDASGRRSPVPVPNSEFIIDADVIVAAIGQEGDYACFCNLPGVDVTKKGAIIINEHFMTNRSGVFSAGDCVTGPDVLIRACAHGRLSALKIDGFLTTGKLEPFEEENNERLLNKLAVFDPKEDLGIPGGVKRMPVKHEPPLERRKDFREVDIGFTRQEAVAEASRCLRCYRVVTHAYTKKRA
ncbi:MAG: FAD-dependent oxidoreductase [bacterium]